MGVKFGREYADIIRDLSEAIGRIGNTHECFEMEAEEWAALTGEEQAECLSTLADDIFFGLGTDPSIPLGRGTVSHDKSRHLIKVTDEANAVFVVYLI